MSDNDSFFGGPQVYIHRLEAEVKELKLKIAALEDELNWVYDHSNEVYILARVEAALPQEYR